MSFYTNKSSVQDDYRVRFVNTGLFEKALRCSRIKIHLNFKLAISILTHLLIDYAVFQHRRNDQRNHFATGRLKVALKITPRFVMV